ncbi:MAG: hypothetical protein RIQ89_1344 [Bacteroidota bacterium]|jgi:leucyl-tRNA synthetase
MEYDFKTVEAEWQLFWKNNKTFKAANPGEKGAERPKYYVLDMFPYPSGAGLHVGHPLGYIASDIFSRYKRHCGYNVLHPMGYDSFGLPAEQYAIQTGQHPAITTAANINRYREQLDKIGFSFDWTREVRTSDPKYYKWTQWIFIQLYNSWYNTAANRAENISTLIAHYRKTNATFGPNQLTFDQLDEAAQAAVLMEQRLAYLGEAFVNWCPALGTVLANDEVKDGVSERGGHPVERKLMKQWSMRITAYADKLLEGLDHIDWPESLKEQQRNWIGKSVGSTIQFKVSGRNDVITVFTTRPDTIFGVSYITLAPENPLVTTLTTVEQQLRVNQYIAESKSRSERERMADVKRISGVFTGAYAIHPFTHESIPIWVGDYVLAGYGTGAVMAVPAHDSRDHAFAKHFDLPIKIVIQSPNDWNYKQASYDEKIGVCINSDFLNGIDVKDAIKKAIKTIAERNFGNPQVNYRLRDAVFGRQRYWGEPIPIYYKNEIAHALSDDALPLLLPEIDKYLPTDSGEPPLARATNFKTDDGHGYETSTMPGWAGSSWYFLRYMDADNADAFVSSQAANYWGSIDLYIGGSEHATGHLLYVRFWTKFLNDIGLININEPAQKLINQGMIQGRSNFVYRLKNENTFVSAGLKEQYDSIAMHVDVNLVTNDVLDTYAFKKWRADFADANFIFEDGKYICGVEIEKMSKSKWNVVNPDDIIAQHGADALRLYEMFLGPLEQSKPWNTNGLSGVSSFLRKLWRLFHQGNNNSFVVSNEAANRKELKTLHKTIKKVTEDINQFSFNTSVSTFMIAVNELTELKCNKKEILEPLLIILSPYAPHIAEELFKKLNGPNNQGISLESWPAHNEAFLQEDSFAYPISINGKMKMNIEFPLALDKAALEQTILNNDQIQTLLQGATPKKVIVVHGKIVNLVL